MMPAIPNSLFITKQMKEYIEGKVIIDFTFSDLDKGKYNVFNISEEKTAPFKGRKIVKADSNFIITENGWLCEFGYSDGTLRYFESNEYCDINHTNSAISGGVALQFVLNDGSRLRLDLSGWSNRLDIRTVDPPDIAYPFRNKFPLEVNDKNDFTFENYKRWLSDHGKTTILEAMVLAKGATDIRTSMMNYILWQSKIHPKRKVNTLTDDEIRTIYDNTVTLVDEYITENRSCFYTDIFGIRKGEDDETLTLFTSRNLNKPCPKCGTSLEYVSGGGTKLYFCPTCQPK
ncbi:MAG: formamidopyrimidine-DNA glycosylase [Herbinix sp.]|jgi:hypothetical protein|nr:formamidopyrimidine-DNA glycosylase [Herbinix sp.]